MPTYEYLLMSAVVLGVSWILTGLLKNTHVYFWLSLGLLSVACLAASFWINVELNVAISNRAIGEALGLALSIAIGMIIGAIGGAIIGAISGAILRQFFKEVLLIIGSIVGAIGMVIGVMINGGNIPIPVSAFVGVCLGGGFGAFFGEFFGKVQKVVYGVYVGAFVGAVCSVIFVLDGKPFFINETYYMITVIGVISIGIAIGEAINMMVIRVKENINTGTPSWFHRFIFLILIVDYLFLIGYSFLGGWQYFV